MPYICRRFFKDPSIIDALALLYNTVDDVDLFVLGLAERTLRGALVGPTFACIIARQFQKVQCCDESQ